MFYPLFRRTVREQGRARAWGRGGKRFFNVQYKKRIQGIASTHLVLPVPGSPKNTITVFWQKLFSSGARSSALRA